MIKTERGPKLASQSCSPSDGGEVAKRKPKRRLKWKDDGAPDLGQSDLETGLCVVCFFDKTAPASSVSESSGSGVDETPTKFKLRKAEQDTTKKLKRGANAWVPSSVRRRKEAESEQGKPQLDNSKQTTATEVSHEVQLATNWQRALEEFSEKFCHFDQKTSLQGWSDTCSESENVIK